MTFGEDNGIFIVEAGGSVPAFSALQAAAVAAIASNARAVLVDLTDIDPVDGAMVAMLAGLAHALAPTRRLAVVASAEMRGYFTEWRLDAVWPTYADREAAAGSLTG